MLSKRDVVSDVNKIFNPLGLRASTTIKHESSLQRMTMARPEQDKPLQDELNKEEGALLYLRTSGLLEERTWSGGKSFATTCLDLMDRVTVKAKTEVYPLLTVCQDTGAVHTQVAYGRSTSAFLTQWDYFVVKRSRPAEVVSDRGIQPISSDDTDLLNRDEIKGLEAEQATVWRFVPVGHQWRNELAESRVKVFKVTRKQMLTRTLSGGKPTLSYEELCTVLTMAANVVNDQPITLRTRTSDNHVPFTMNQLMSERTSGVLLEPRAVQDIQFFVTSSYQQDLLNLWWKLWKEEGFASLPLYGHLMEAKKQTGLEVGDVCLLNHENKGCGTYRLCSALSTTTSTGSLGRKV